MKCSAYIELWIVLATNCILPKAFRVAPVSGSFFRREKGYERKSSNKGVSRVEERKQRSERNNRSFVGKNRLFTRRNSNFKEKVAYFIV